MRKFYTSSFNPPTPKSLRAFARLVRERLDTAMFFFPASTILVLVVAATRRREAWFPVALSTVVLTVASGFVPSWMQPHYLAPMVGALALAFTGGARHLAALRVGPLRAGRLVAWATLCLALVSAGQTAFLRHRDRDTKALSWSWQRAQMANRLQATGGQHLVFVRYGPAHSALFEWVFNGADIDGSPVVWARSLGPAADARARAYFGGRTAWRLVVDRDSGPFVLEPLESGALP